MFQPRFVFVIMTVSSLVFPSCESKTVISAGNETDRISLLEFKAKLTDPFGVLNSWNDSLHFCLWHGVTCGNRHRRVIRLTLNSTRLVGTLSPHIGNLSFLRRLNLVQNIFYGGIPEELGRLHRLKGLGLENNTFSGQIPTNISRCSNLVQLFFAGNHLTGKLPSEFNMLSKLEYFTFHGNNILGEIPPAYGNLSSLLHISGYENRLTGAIPESIGCLKQLEFLSLSMNFLTGLIPSSIFNLTSLTVFSVFDNQLEGTLPPDLGTLLPNLERLQLGPNLLMGSIPPSLSNASNLWHIQLFQNRFSGKVPSLAGLDNLGWLGVRNNNLGNGEEGDLNFLSSLVNCSRLTIIDILGNNFGGFLPEYIGNFSTTLKKIIFSENQIQGPIPSGIGNLVGLDSLYLNLNQLTGEVPSSIGKLPRLVLLNLEYNKLAGRIPSSLGNLTSLQKISLNLNKLQGRIPASIGNWRNVLLMDFARNELYGNIPPEMMTISPLSMGMDLSENLLTGLIPLEIGELVGVGAIVLSNNMLSGEIPATLGSCTSLERLSLDGNSLHGEIPEALSSMRGINYLDLSRNNLSGKIPLFMSRFALKYLNLSFNDFEGQVQIQGVFRNSSGVSLLGNPKLCGGISQLKLPICRKPERHNKFSVKSRRIVVAVSSVLLLVLIILLILFLVHQRSRKAKNTTVATPLFGDSFPRITYGDLFRCTNGFSSNNLIGTGGFGSVYKGILSQNNTESVVVAVKVLNLQQKGALKSFMAECKALRLIRHRNLVKTLTVCSSTDFSGNDFKALVYEFKANGSLEDWLHPVRAVEDSPTGPFQHLDLTQRLNIAIDVANGVEYLHKCCEEPVVHGDIKPSNVVLDDEMTACIGDFGLARLISNASLDQQSSNSASSAGFMGSIGYAAPEYGMGGRVSESSDIYSYGILLLEMFTGKRPTDETFNDSLNIHDYVNAALPQEVLKIVDPVLLQTSLATPTSSNNSHNNVFISDDKSVDCLVSVLGIGLACSSAMPKDRMDITDVVARLSSIRTKLVSAGLRRRS